MDTDDFFLGIVVAHILTEILIEFEKEIYVNAVLLIFHKHPFDKF